MSFVYLLACVIAIALLGYLFVALFRPEDF